MIVEMRTTRCEGWRRRGGAFTLGPVKWYQCENAATVEIAVAQDGQTVKYPACPDCWREATERGLDIQGVTIL